ncbi:MAG: hypothetical protein HGA77_02335 [Chlorobiaceae bacterium]|nr:hypothetical protein [Chlorobiaceae bacterium]
MQDTMRIQKFLAVILVMLAGGCASDRPPSGGPADTTPLRVVLSSPAPSEINVSDRTIHLKFNHFFTGRQLLRALAFSPSVGQFDVRVDGRNAEIRFLEPLKSNSTYTLFIDKNLKDFRGRSFSEPFSLAFSTGPSLDAGSIEGSVCNTEYSPAVNALVLAYDASRENKGTLALLESVPDYLTQASAAGAFSFRNLAPGRYRIFAVNDRNGDRRYSGPGEEIGITAASSLPEGTSGVSLMLAGSSSIQGIAASCRSLDSRHIEIRTMVPVSPAVFRDTLPDIREADSGSPLRVTAWYGRNMSMFDDVFILETGRMKAGRLYRAGAPGSKGIEFFGSGAKPSETPLKATVFPENGSDPAFLDMAWPSLGNAVVIRFSIPVDELLVNRAARLEETVSGAALPFSVIPLDPFTCALKPISGFKPGSTYKLALRMETLAPPASKEGARLPVESLFTASLPDDAGTITGSCTAPGPFVIVEARMSGSHSAIYRTRAIRERNGVFRYTFSGLPPGQYRVMAFSPSTQKEPDLWRPHFPGSIEPFMTAEPFALHGSPVNVRARWTTGHIDISITK